RQSTAGPSTRTDGRVRLRSQRAIPISFGASHRSVLRIVQPTALRPRLFLYIPQIPRSLSEESRLAPPPRRRWTLNRGRTKEKHPLERQRQDGNARFRRAPCVKARSMEQGAGSQNFRFSAFQFSAFRLRRGCC